jgi:hypothetical protein
MSIFKYFTASKTSTPEENNVILPSLESSGVSTKEYDSILDSVNAPTKDKRCTYKEEDKIKMTKYANTYGVANAVRRYCKEFPSIKEGTIRGWLKKF